MDVVCAQHPLDLLIDPDSELTKTENWLRQWIGPDNELPQTVNWPRQWIDASRDGGIVQ